MLYQGKPVLSDPDLDPGDLYLLTITFGHQLMLLMDYTDMVLGLSAQPTNRQARLVTWFCALCCARMADVVDYDAYEGDVSAEQLGDYQVEWPDVSEKDEGIEPRLYLEKVWLLRDQGVALNFIDLLTAQVCTEFSLLQAAELDKRDPGKVQAPLLKSLAIAAEPDVLVLTRLIDHLLYNAGVPLLTERYVLAEDGVDTQTWRNLDEGAMSDHFQPMAFEHLEEFLAMRQSPDDMPVGQATSVVGSFYYSIRLAKEPDDE